jgi:hypothetical protein
MNKKNFRSISIGALLACLSMTAAAHHSFNAEFDASRPIVLKGVVQRMEFSNPHSWIYLKVTTASGEVQDWAVEGAAPNALLRRGFNRSSLAPGTEVTIRGFHARDRSFRAAGRDVTLADGSKLFVGGNSSEGAPPPDAAQPSAE